MSQGFEYFGKYILLEKLAAGGMAEVFLGRAPGAGGIGKFVAVKRILPQFSDNPEYIDMFKSEAKIAVNLSHSNVVAINEFGIQEHSFFLIMEYVEGRNLRQILNKMKKVKGELAIEQVIYIVKEIAAGLDHAHRCLDGTTGKPLNLIHRDMSPQNIMVGFEGQVKIIDFGIAKSETQLETTRAGTLKGKYGYMSPEQAEGQEVDLRTDIFSLGIVLWELLAGDRLFIANNEINTLRKIRDCQVPSLKKINPNIHSELERIVQKALARDRNLRYQYAAALNRDLNRFLNRQYPDFSPHDFAVAVKTLFSEEILNLRKRLIEYSKIPFPGAPDPANSDDKTIVTIDANTDTKSSFFNQTKSEFNPGLPGSTNDPNKTFTLSQASRNKDESSLGVTRNTQSILDNSAIVRNMNESSPLIHAPGGLQIHTNGPHKPNTSTSNFRLGVHTSTSDIITSTSLKKHPRMRIQRTIRAAVLPLLIAAVTFLLYSSFVGSKDGFVNKAINIVGTSLKRVILLENQGKKDISSKQKSNSRNQPANIGIATNAIPIVINSKPSGAEIYINGKYTGKVTPSRIDVAAGQPFSLSLKKNLYIDYTKESLSISHEDSRSFTATLQRALIGYLDIDVKPPMYAKIYVNGELLDGEKLPITKYAVPAYQNLKIRAIDPYSNRFDEKTVKLRQDQRSSIILHLNQRSRRRPSNSK